MDRLTTSVLVVVGIAVGAYAQLPPQPDGERLVAEVTRISAAPDRAMRSPFVTEIAKLNSAAAKSDGDVRAVKVQQAWTTVIADGAGGSPLVKSSKPGDAVTRYELTRDLQRGLKRAGCYGGEVHGYWTAATKRAMAAFIERVNATLPIEEPDFILLSLVQGNASATCSSECAANEQHDDYGRCIPRAVLAQAVRRSERAEARRQAEALRAAQHDYIVETHRDDAVKIAHTETPRAEPAKGLKRIEAPRLLRERPAGATINTNPARIAAAPTAAETLPWLKSGPTEAKRPDRPRPPGMMAMGATTSAAPLPDPNAQRAIPNPGATAGGSRIAALEQETGASDAAQPAPATAAGDAAIGLDDLDAAPVARPAKRIAAPSGKKKLSSYSSSDSSYKPRRSRNSVGRMINQAVSGVY